MLQPQGDLSIIPNIGQYEYCAPSHIYGAAPATVRKALGSASKQLVAALCEAAQAELLSMVSGGEPYPSSMSDLRALRLRYMCQAAERLLTTREVSVLFHTTDSGAQSLLTRMEVLPGQASPNISMISCRARVTGN